MGDVMRETMAAIARLAPQLGKDPVALAETVFEAVSDDGYGAFDQAVPALSEALGTAGMTRLKALAEEARDAPLTEADLGPYHFIPDRAARTARALAGRNRTVEMILQDVADAEGDVDGWLAQYTAEQLTYAPIAPSAANRLLAAGRPVDALHLVETALARDTGTPGHDRAALDEAHFACLEALGRKDALRAALWHRFERHLCPDALRRHLKLLPDFDDIEAEEAARRHVLDFDPVESALAYCLGAPDLPLAAELVEARWEQIDGEAYEILTPLAEALAPGHPLSAVLLWRAMVDFALTRARSGRYGHTARHLEACAATEADILDYGMHLSHGDYVETLRAAHGRKAGFWRRLQSG